MLALVTEPAEPHSTRVATVADVRPRGAVVGRKVQRAGKKIEAEPGEEFGARPIELREQGALALPARHRAA